MKTHSQAGQDLFVAALLPHNEGTFIDIGCSHPTELSNTYALEQERGWRGVLMDSNLNSIGLCVRDRKSLPICADATNFDWTTTLQHLGKMPIDYLSLDVDEWTHAALLNLLKAKPRFCVITIEHDQYQRGDRLRIPNRSILAAEGYDLIAADVHSNGCCFEDWWVARGLSERANKFRSVGFDWADVLKQGGAL